MIAVVDYGMGNLGSIQNMLKKIGEKEVKITDEPEVLEKVDGIILPGVGAFDRGVDSLRMRGLDKVIKEHVLNKKKPILGICLGMQLLGEKSEEGSLDGLGLIDFECKKFEFNSVQYKIPHMGWDYVNIEKQCELTRGLEKDARFYFVHSYMAKCKDKRDILMSCEYGIKFAAAVNKDNIYGVQFHPEKSHRFGMLLMKNFSEVCKNV